MSMRRGTFITFFVTFSEHIQAKAFAVFHDTFSVLATQSATLWKTQNALMFMCKILNICFYRILSLTICLSNNSFILNLIIYAFYVNAIKFWKFKSPHCHKQYNAVLATSHPLW